MEQDLYHAFTSVDLQRVHVTLTIDDFDCIKEDIRYVFYNMGSQKVSVLPLPARERKIQRNMIVKDCSQRNLVFIPSNVSTNHLVEASSHILKKASELVDDSEKQAFLGIKEDVERNLRKIFKCDSRESDIVQVSDKIRSVLNLKSIQSRDFIEEIFPLLDLLEQYRKGFYRPLVTLLDSLEPQNHALIHLSVERLKEFLRDARERFRTLAWFGISGRFTFATKLDIQPDVSNHVRIYAPGGMLIKDVELVICQKKLKGYLDDYFDEKCFYFHSNPEESSFIYKFKPDFRIIFGLSKKGFHLGLFPLLSLLLWFTIISPIFFKVLRSPGLIIALLGVSATILVTIGVYAVDKKILRHFITVQIILVYLVYAAEILLFYFA